MVTSGVTNGLLYANGSVLGNLATLASGVLVTSAGGVPSISTTLPAGIAIPGPSFTGTVTLPDAATWTATGISKAVALSVGSATLPSGGNISISGQYQINGTQIAASNLSNGTTGSGAVVLAAAPAISGVWTGNPTFSGNITHSGQLIASGTSAPGSAAGNTVVMGTIASPTITNTGQAFLYNTVVNGAIIEGDGSTNDVSLFNKSGALVAGVPTGTTKLNFPSLSSGTCSSGLGLDSGNNTILVSCPGAAGSIQVGTTTVVSGTNNYILTSGTGTLANVTIASLLTQGAGITITGTTNATISQALTNTSFSNAAVAGASVSVNTAQMNGLGSSCKLTPTYSGRISVQFNWDGLFATGSGSFGVTYSLRFADNAATAAPAANASIVGSAIAGPITYTATVGSNISYSQGGIVTGLTPGHLYWFDIATTSNGTSSAQIVGANCYGFEF